MRTLGTELIASIFFCDLVPMRDVDIVSRVLRQYFLLVGGVPKKPEEERFHVPGQAYLVHRSAAALPAYQLIIIPRLW
jgi:hypothetical protein